MIQDIKEFGAELGAKPFLKGPIPLVLLRLGQGGIDNVLAKVFVFRHGTAMFHEISLAQLKHFASVPRFRVGLWIVNSEIKLQVVVIDSTETKFRL